MGLPTAILRHFMMSNGIRTESNGLQPRCLIDLIENRPEATRNLIELTRIINKLVAEGLLRQVGYETGNALTNKYWTNILTLDETVAEYGSYDFSIYGFPYIRTHFKDSVLPVVVVDDAGNHGIGSGFLVNEIGLVTAAHCIRNMHSIKIPGWNPDVFPLASISLPRDTSLAVAYFRFEADPFPASPKFIFGEANILDEVLTMGYPPISGFDNILVAETATVAGHLKSTVGQAITTARSYLDRQNYLLISARIKGGSSGGPVVNRDGFAVGVISGEPSNFSEVDTLGFGIAVPSQEFVQCFSSEQEVAAFQTIPFERLEDGIRTLI